MKINFILSRFLLLTLFSLLLISDKSLFAKKVNNLDESGDTEYGISAGMWLSGTIEIWTSEWSVESEKSSSLMLRGIVDKNIAKDFSAGLYANFSKFENDYNDIEGTMKEFGFTLKPRFYLNPTVIFKPGLNIGYRQIAASEINDVDGMGLNASFEIQFLCENSAAFYIDFGFLAQPIGGNSDWHLTFGPIFYLLGGVAF